MLDLSTPKVIVIGGGLAGSEAAWQCLKAGHAVDLYERRPHRMSPAHKTGGLAELVCSNTFKSLDENSASGQLKKEMLALDSLIIAAAHEAAIPAGGALGVDRDVFSTIVEKKLLEQKKFRRIDVEVTELPSQKQLEESNCQLIVATGPLSTESICDELKKLCGDSFKDLYFYDAIAPIIDAESIDFSECFFANRYDDSEGGDYLNLPLSKEQYESLIDDIIAAEKTPLHEFESTNYFECCLPIEVMAERGRETLRFGPMKPVGLIDPKTRRRAWAVVQLRKENEAATMYSMVGFQTKMKWPEQKRIFTKLPGLKNAEFFRLGSVHRNTYLKSPQVLNTSLQFKSAPNIYLAGQITGVEGYGESAAMGLLAGRFASSAMNAKAVMIPPRASVLGALLEYVSFGGKGEFQPMNANMGMLPPVEKASDDRRKKIPKKERRGMQIKRAASEFNEYLKQLQ